MVGSEMISRPFDTITTGVKHIFDLFEIYLWPNTFSGRLSSKTLSLHLNFFFLLVCIPALMRILNIVSCWRQTHIVEKSACMALFGLFFTSAATMGEARYRVPFDGILILLASAYYVSATPNVKSAASLEKVLSQIVVLASACIAALIVGLSHPNFPGRAEFIDWLKSPKYHGATEFDTIALEKLDQEVRIENHRVYGGNTYEFACSRACRGIEVQIPSLRGVKAIQFSVEDDDEYQIQLFKGTQVISTNYRGPWYSAKRVFRPYSIPVAARIRNEGPYRVVISPFFGDGVYRLRHVRLIHEETKSNDG
jgi:hypothetical protein